MIYLEHEQDWWLFSHFSYLADFLCLDKYLLFWRLRECACLSDVYLRLMIITKISLTGAGRDAQRTVWVTWAKGKSVECNGKFRCSKMLKRLGCDTVSSKLIAWEEKSIMCTVLQKQNVMENKTEIPNFVIFSLMQWKTQTTSK